MTEYEYTDDATGQWCELCDLAQCSPDSLCTDDDQEMVDRVRKWSPGHPEIIPAEVARRREAWRNRPPGRSHFVGRIEL